MKDDLDIITDNNIEVKKLGSTSCQFLEDDYRVYEKYFKGSEYFFNENKFRVVDIDKEHGNNSISSNLIEDDKVATLLFSILNIECIGNLKWLEVNHNYYIANAKSRIKINLVGYNEYFKGFIDKEIADNSGKSKEFVHYPNPIIKIIEDCNFVLIKFDELEENVIHTIVHALKVILKRYIYIQNIEFYICDYKFHEDNKMYQGIIILDPIKGGIGLTELIEEKLGSIFKDCYYLITSCECINGCDRCLLVYDCHLDLCNEAIINKIGAIEYLGKINNIPEKVVQQEIERRTAGLLKQEDAQRIFDEVREAYNSKGLPKVECPIQLLDPEKFNAQFGENTAGVFVSPKPPLPGAVVIYIKKGYEVSYLRYVMAHEYIHAYDFKNNFVSKILQNVATVPFQGLFFTEGFAEWASAQITPGFNNWKDNAFDRYVKESEHYNEYKGGHILLTYIEQNGIEPFKSFSGVLKYLKDAPNEIKVNEIEKPVKLCGQGGLYDLALIRTDLLNQKQPC